MVLLRDDLMKITLEVPKEYFKTFPEVIDYSLLTYGRMEKACRLLARSMRSALDNKENAKKYNEIMNKIRDIRRDRGNLYNKRESLRNNIHNLRGMRWTQTNEVFCSTLRSQIISFEAEFLQLKQQIETLDKEVEQLKAQLPKYMQGGYWW